MPSHKSAEKRVRQTEKKTIRNRKIISTLKTSVKSLLALIDGKKAEEAKKLLPSVISTIDKAATKGAIHKNNSARRISRLATKVKNIQAAQ